MSRAPIRSSRADIFRLTVDFGMPRSFAASVKLPAAATRANTSIPLRSNRLVAMVLNGSERHPHFSIVPFMGQSTLRGLASSPSSIGSPQKSLAVETRVVGIQVDVHASDQTIAEFEGAAEPPARGFATLPAIAAARRSSRGPFDDHRIPADDVFEVRQVVDELSERAQ